MRLRRLPIPLRPASGETIASYTARLAAVHRVPYGELWWALSVPLRPGAVRRRLVLDRLAEPLAGQRRPLDGTAAKLAAHHAQLAVKARTEWPLPLLVPAPQPPLRRRARQRPRDHQRGSCGSGDDELMTPQVTSCAACPIHGWTSR